MPEPLRFTSENPPPHLWANFPNWRNALEEEGEKGRDETTLMPDEVQAPIGEDTSFTAGKVRLLDGREFPAFLSVGENGLDGCEAYQEEIPWPRLVAPVADWVVRQRSQTLRLHHG